MRGQFHNLQALRGVACLLVVWYHVALWSSDMGVRVAALTVAKWFGFAGVDLFFVLSGFIIAHTTAADRGRPRAVPRYLFRRLWRIYPTFWAAMLVSAAIGVAILEWPHFRIEALGEWPRWLSLAPIEPANPIIGPAWTLTYEVMFYLAFGVLLILPRQVASIGLIAWAAVVGVAVYGSERPGGLWSGLPISPFVLEFLGGVLVASLIRWGVCVGPRTAIGLGIAVAMVGILAALRVNPDLPFGVLMAKPRPRVMVFAPAAVLIVYGAAAAEVRGLRRPPQLLQRIGDASYSIYLIHTIVLLACIALWIALPFRFPRVPWLLGMFVTAVGLGTLFYRCVERPLLNLVKRKKPTVLAAEPSAIDAQPLRKVA